MKLKRILAGIIACTMVATAMGVTAFAADTEPTDVVTTTETEILAGDVNNDGEVDMKDALDIARYLVAGDEEAKANFAQLLGLNLDAVRDENGYIGISSVINILKEVVKTPPETTPEDTETTPEDTETTPVDTETTPVDTETTPVDTDTTPVDTETTPVDTETTPVDTETTPVDTETTPVETEDPELVESAKADLADAIAIGDVERLNNDYTADSWKALDVALKAAKAVKEDATIAEIVAATEALTAAINGLITVEEAYEAAKAELATLIADAEAKLAAEDVADPYESTSKSTLKTSVTSAKNRLNSTYNPITAAEIETFITNITLAIENIKTTSQVLFDKGEALKADIAIAKKYQVATGTGATTALNTAITNAEALFERTGYLKSTTTLTNITASVTAIKTALTTEVAKVWVDTKALAIAGRANGYDVDANDVLAMAEFELTEAEMKLIEDTAAAAVLADDTKNYDELVEKAIYDKLVALLEAKSVTTAEYVALVEAFKAKTDVIAANAKADFVARFNELVEVTADDYEKNSYDALTAAIATAEGDIIKIGIGGATAESVSNITALTHLTALNTAFDGLVTKVQAEAKANALKYVDDKGVLATGAITGIKNYIEKDGTLVKLNVRYNVLSTSAKINFNKALNEKYAIIAKASASTNPQEINVDELNAAITAFENAILELNEAYIVVLKADLAADIAKVAAADKDAVSTYVGDKIGSATIPNVIEKTTERIAASEELYTVLANLSADTIVKSTLTITKDATTGSSYVNASFGAAYDLDYTDAAGVAKTVALFEDFQIEVKATDFMADGKIATTGSIFAALANYYDTTASTGAVAPESLFVTITFNANDEAAEGSIEDIKVVSGNKITLPDGTGLTLDGKLFKGWAISADSTQKLTGDETYPSSETLYAIWE